jgi:hypothetical protein
MNRITTLAQIPTISDGVADGPDKIARTRGFRSIFRYVRKLRDRMNSVQAFGHTGFGEQIRWADPATESVLAI